MSQMHAKLSEIVEAIELPDEMSAFLDRQTGRVLSITEEDSTAAEDDELAEQAPDWQQESIETARRIEADTEGRFLALPDQFHAHEWQMMADFAADLEDEAAGAELDRAIRGKGAFRYFKDKIHDLGMADQWYAYRDGCYRKLAIDWCEANGLEWH